MKMDAKEINDDICRMLSESGYSDKAIEYLKNQESVGVLAQADQITDLIGPCGDTMKISLSIKDEKIEDAKIQVLGCPGAVASGSALISIAKGMKLEEARKLDLDSLYRELEKLPDQKVHCARLALKTLHKAVEEYMEKMGKSSVNKATGGGI